MIKKSEIIQTLENLPDEVSVDELIDRIIFINKVETGKRQSEKGEVFSTDEAKKRLKKWLK